jgi:cell wall-associated NlpC family hydrolase
VIATIALAGLTFTGPGPQASADRHYPSAGEVAASKAKVASRSEQVGQIEARFAAANARSARLAVEVAQAVEAYNGARVRLDQAVSAAEEAQRKADGAREGVADARRELGTFAAAAYRSGGDLAGLTTFFAAEGPRDLISRAAALESIGFHRENALDRLRSAQAVAGVMQDRADATVAARRKAARAVENAKQAAESQLAAQRRAVVEIRTQRGNLVRALAAARHTTVRLESERQAGIEADRRRAARKAAAAEAKRRAAEAARVAREAEQARKAQEAKDARDRADREAADRAASQQGSDSNSAGSGGSSADNGNGGSGDGGGSGGGGSGGGNSPSAPPSGNSAGSASGAEAAISYARAQLGKPYVWAADGPSSFDCSGLTMRAWQQGGVGLPHYSVAQYESGQKVGLGELRRGDLVFFASSDSDYTTIFHVGLYIGDGQMIEAPYTGENVRISSIWRSSLFGAARP